MKRRTFLKISLPILATPSLSAEKSSHTPPELVFGVIADPQYADAQPRGSRYYRNSLQKLSSAITELNKQPLEFTVTLGDVIDREFDSFEKIMPHYDRLKSTPYFVLGNHDFDVADEDKSKVMKALKMKKSYYSMKVGNWAFIFLDGTDVSIYRQAKNSPATQTAQEVLDSYKKNKKAQAQPWNGALGSKQMEWLAAELDAVKGSDKRVIIFNHFPIFPLGDAHNLWNDEAVLKLISQCPNVVAYMNGHDHKGKYNQNKHCHFVNFKGMVESEREAPFAVVKCYKDRIEIDGYEPEPDRNLVLKN